MSVDCKVKWSTYYTEWYPLIIICKVAWSSNMHGAIRSVKQWSSKVQGALRCREQQEEGNWTKSRRAAGTRHRN